MISDEYTEMLQNKINSISNDQNDDLESFFRLGQFVLCRVIESAAIMDSEKTKEQKRLHLSINPKDVCDQITPDQLMKGMVSRRNSMNKKLTMNKFLFRFYPVWYRVLPITVFSLMLVFHREKDFLRKTNN